MDMWFYWAKDRVSQGQIKAYWVPGRNNFVDYHTKHDSASHHAQQRSKLLVCCTLVDPRMRTRTPTQTASLRARMRKHFPAVTHDNFQKIRIFRHKYVNNRRLQTDP